MNDTYVTMCGNVVDDPVARTTRAGEAWTTFRLASTPWRYDQRQRTYVDGETSYVDVSMFRRLAQHVQLSLAKGDPVIVHGRLKVTPWQRGESSGINVEIEAQSVGHDLNRGVGAFTRSRAEAPSAPSAPPAPMSSGSGGPSAIDPRRADTDEYVVRTA
ncbi:MAG: single-stranded DNA-binding protein [Mobilicoccus sp.]|nr:single-stranded DNA-binding protein [Mobilicoccus sp.]